MKIKFQINIDRLPVRWGWVRHYRVIKGVWEDVCPHGIGHEPGIHGCDGCCEGLYKKLKSKK